MGADWHGVRDKTEKVREAYGIEEPPVNVFDIAKNEGIEIIYFEPDKKTKDISGFLIKDKKRVYLNANESAPRQNFTLAHELAHHFLNHEPNEYGVYKRDSLYSKIKPEKEQEADSFAAELLMPKKLVRSAQKEYRLSDRDSALLAKLFGVSPSAMKYRLQGLRHDYTEKK